MKKAMKNVLLILLVIAMLAAFAGCKQGSSGKNGLLSVETVQIIPAAYLNEPYDLRDIIIMEEGVEYSATGRYVEITRDAETNVFEKNEYPLQINDLCFTPVVMEESVITLTATWGKQTASKIVYIPTLLHSDPLDDLFKSEGLVGWADPGFTKSVNLDRTYVKGENSNTSLYVEFSGTDIHDWGNTILNLSDESVQKHFTDQDWKNAIVTFWVYNPMDKDIQFQLAVSDSNHAEMRDWNTEPGSHQQYAKAGQWTQIFFSLRKLGTKHKLTQSVYTTDYLGVKVQYADYSTKDPYAFSFYIDNLDIVPGDTYPDIDTTYTASDETIEQGWENMAMDTGWQGARTIYDYENFMGEGSECSLYATFNSDKGLSNPFVVLSPELAVIFDQITQLPDMTGGELSGYFKFKGANPEVKVDLYKAVGNVWLSTKVLPMKLTPVGDDWYKGTLDVSELEFSTERNDGVIRIRFCFTGITKESEIWMDSIKFVYKNAGRVKESADKDWINFPLDEGMTKVQKYEYSPNYKKATGSVRSIKMIAPRKETGTLTWAPQYAVMTGDAKSLPDLTKGTLHAYFYFGDQTPKASLRVYNELWHGSKEADFMFESVGDGWYYGSVPAGLIQGYPKGDGSKIIRMSISIPAGYTVYIDGLMHYPNEEYVTILNPDDVFASGVFTATEFIGNSGYEVTSEDTNNSADAIHIWSEEAIGWPNVGVSFAAPVDLSSYRGLTFDVKASDAHQWVGIKLYYLDSNGVENYAIVGRDFLDKDWQNVSAELSEFANADLTKVTGILLCVNYDSDFKTGKNNQFWFDNLKLIADGTNTPSENEDHNDLLSNAVLEWGEYHDAAYGGIDGYTYDGNCTDIVCGEGSIKSWKFTVAAGKGGRWGKAQLKLPNTVDLTDKLLAFDIKLENVYPWIDVRLQDSSWAEIGYWCSDIQATTEWQTVTIDPATLAGSGNAVKLFLIQFGVNDDTNKALEQVFYIDNLRLIDKESEEPTEPTEPIEPTEPTEPAEPTQPTEPTEDKNDLLANAVMEWGEYHTADRGGIDGYTYDGNCTDVVCGDGSIKSWKFTVEAGKGGRWGKAQLKLPNTVDMTGKLLVFDIKLENVYPWIDVRLQDSSWAEIGYWCGDIQATTEWQTITIDPATFTGSGDAGNLFLIKFGVNDDTNKNQEQVFWIDNLRLEEKIGATEQTERATDLLATATLEWGEYANQEGYSCDKNCTDMVYGEGSIRSWKFAVAAGAGGWGKAQIKLPKAMNLTGKLLVFDIKLVNVHSWIDVKLHNSSWADNGYWCGDIQATSDWQTVTIDPSALAGCNPSDVLLITFGADTDTNKKLEQIFYIDNLRLIDK